MKKYVKPELIYESFELTEQIAACDFDSKNSFTTVEQCSFTGSSDNFGIGEGTYFLDTNSSCNIKLEAYCYHASAGGVNLFNS